MSARAGCWTRHAVAAATAIALMTGLGSCAAPDSAEIRPDLAIGPSYAPDGDPRPQVSTPQVFATSCSAFMLAAQSLPTHHQNLVLAQGTMADPVPIFQEIVADMAVLDSLGPYCAPGAVGQIAELSAASNEVMTYYQTDATGPMGEKSAAVLDIMAQRGREAFAAMDLSPSAWP